MRPLIRQVSGIGFLLAALGALGCQGRGDVSGTVTFGDRPVKFGTVLFEGSDGVARQGNIEKDGSYSVRDVASGQARVTVNSPNPRSITMTSKGDRKPEPFPDVPDWFPIPREYGDLATSGLTYTVKGGSNTINIELKPR